MVTLSLVIEQKLSPRSHALCRNTESDWVLNSQNRKSLRAYLLNDNEKVTGPMARCRAHLKGVRHALPDAVITALAASAHAFVAADLAALVVRAPSWLAICCDPFVVKLPYGCCQSKPEV